MSRRRVRAATQQHVQIAALLALGAKVTDFSGSMVKVGGKLFYSRHLREVQAMRAKYRAERRKRAAA